MLTLSKSKITVIVVVLVAGVSLGLVWYIKKDGPSGPSFEGPPSSVRTMTTNAEQGDDKSKQEKEEEIKKLQKQLSESIAKQHEILQKTNQAQMDAQRNVQKTMKTTEQINRINRQVTNPR